MFNLILQISIANKEQRCIESRAKGRGWCLCSNSDSDAYFNTYFYADFYRGYRAQASQSVPVVGGSPAPLCDCTVTHTALPYTALLLTNTHHTCVLQQARIRQDQHDEMKLPELFSEFIYKIGSVALLHCNTLDGVKSLNINHWKITD